MFHLVEVVMVAAFNYHPQIFKLQMPGIGITAQQSPLYTHELHLMQDNQNNDIDKLEDEVSHAIRMISCEFGSHHCYTQ